jgi:flagellin
VNGVGTTVTVTAAGTGTSALFQFVDLSGGTNTNVSFNITATNISSAATNGSFTVNPASQSLQFQIGANANTSTITSNTLDVNLGNMSAQALGLQDSSGNNLIVTSAQAAQNAIGTVDNALSMLTTSRANVGSYENQLTYTMSTLQTESTNLQAAQSDIMDVNMAAAMTQFTQDQVLQQSGAAMLAQAQALPDLILKLLG